MKADSGSQGPRKDRRQHVDQDRADYLRLVKRAAPIIAQQGLGVTLAEMSRLAKLPEGRGDQLFSSREQLLLAVIEHQASVLTKSARDRLGAGRGAPALADFVDIFLDDALREPQQARTRHLIFEDSKTNPVLEGALARSMAEVIGHLEAQFEVACSHGYMGPPVDARIEATVLLSALHAVVAAWLRNNHEPSLGLFRALLKAKLEERYIHGPARVVRH